MRARPLECIKATFAKFSPCVMRELKGKWSDAQEILVRARPLENIKATFTKVGLYVTSKGLDSIRYIDAAISEAFIQS